MVAMAALQVFIVKMFFTGGRKGEFYFAVDDSRGRVLMYRDRVCVSDDFRCIASGNGVVSGAQDSLGWLLRATYSMIVKVNAAYPDSVSSLCPFRRLSMFSSRGNAST